jgi:hypothetical protein
MKEIQNKVFSLCCGGKKCPVVNVSGSDWSIKDDFGGEVKLTEGQVKELLEKAQPLVNDE